MRYGRLEDRGVGNMSIALPRDTSLISKVSWISSSSIGSILIDVGREWVSNCFGVEGSLRSTEALMLADGVIIGGGGGVIVNSASGGF